MAGKDTPEKHSGLAAPWKPGQSGNPKGRPKGSRTKLGEEFVSALQADFQEHGKAVIAAVREEKPADYLKVVASILPKQVEIKEGTFDGFSDEQLAALVVSARSALNFVEGGGRGTEAEAGPQQAEGLPAVH